MAILSARSPSVRNTILFLLLLAAAAQARAATELATISASPDTTAVFGGLEIRDHGVFSDDLAGLLAPVSLGDLPESAAVDAFHDAGDGTVLFSLDTGADLDGLPVSPADVVSWDGSTYALVFDALAAGVPAGTDLDALTADGDDLLLSFDTTVDLPGGPFDDEDLVRWDGSTFSLELDGEAAGVPPGADLDAAHRLINGNLLLSFDTGGVVGGVTFADEDALELDPGSGTWALAYDGSAEHPGWVAADLDALAVGEPPSVLEIPTLSPPALVLLALVLLVAGLRLSRGRGVAGVAGSAAIAALLAAALATPLAAQPLLLDQPATQESSVVSDLGCGFCQNGSQVVAEDVVLAAPGWIDTILVRGGYVDDEVYDDRFRVQIYADSAGLPGLPALYAYSGLPAFRQATGLPVPFSGSPLAEHRYAIELPAPAALAAGTYWIEIANDSTGQIGEWVLGYGTLDPVSGRAGCALSINGSVWFASPANLNLRIPFVLFADGFESGGTTSWSATQP